MKKVLFIFLSLPFVLSAQQVTDLQDALQLANEKPCTYDWMGFADPQHTQAIAGTNGLPVQMKLVHQTNSLIGTHQFYVQEVYGIPVWNGYIKINKAKNGTVLSVFNHLSDISTWPTQFTTPVEPNKGKPYLLAVNGQPVLIYERMVNYQKVITDASGNTIQEQDSRLYFANDDSTVSGKVFRPDPLTPSNLIYGQGNLLHYNDSDYAAINDKRVSVTFPATFRNDSFYLENQYAKVFDFMPPYNGRAVSKTPNFDFTRKTNAFKEVMALYHISNLQTYLHSIGIDSLVPYQLKVDAHSGTADVSSFTYSPDTTLNFGLGGVPDAEDADVIIHEYTHAISHSLNPSGISSNERRALEEANCDIFATTYSREYAPFNWRYMFNFDGPNPVTNGQFPYWGGRNCNSNKKYSNKTNDFYSDSEIWSSGVLDIAEEVNRETLTKLLLTSMYSYTPNTGMLDAAYLFMQADSLLYNKFNSWKMGKHFVNRELGTFNTSLSPVKPSDLFSIQNSAAFAMGESALVVVFKKPAPNTLTVFDLTGKTLFTRKTTTDRISIAPDELPKGIYLLMVETPEGRQTVKMVR